MLGEPQAEPPFEGFGCDVGAGKRRRPSKSYALVDAWLEEGRACRRRYRFLIIEGPYCVGKTHLFGHDSCFATN